MHYRNTLSNKDNEVSTRGERETERERLLPTSGKRQYSTVFIRYRSIRIIHIHIARLAVSCMRCDAKKGIMYHASRHCNQSVASVVPLQGMHACCCCPLVITTPSLCCVPKSLSCLSVCPVAIHKYMLVRSNLDAIAHSRSKSLQ